MTGDEPVASAPGESMSRQMRGSSLLLGGRIFYIAITLIVQVIIVRALTQSDYGAFAYALAIVLMVENVAHLGLDRAVPRFVPIYHEQHDAPRLFGTIALAIATVLCVGALALLALYGFESWMRQTILTDGRVLDLLLVLIVLAPLNALDQLFESLMAVFARPRAIVLRKHVLGPLMRLAVVSAAIVMDRGVTFIAVGYVVAAAAGVIVYLPLLAGVMGNLGFWRMLRRGGLRFPVRETFSFGLPLLSADLVHVVRNTTDAILLGHFRGAVGVASLRAVQPAARLNDIVAMNFALLFTPQMSRFYARRDGPAADNLYWQTALWQAVLSFPILAMTFSLADVVTVALFGEQYAASAVVLALLALGLYTNAAFGPNTLALRVFGRVKYVVKGNVLAAGVNLGLNLALIPPLGAAGAALAATITLLGHNAYNHAGLRATGIRSFASEHTRVYGTILAAMLVMGLAYLVPGSPAALRFVIALGASFAVISSARGSLDLASTFPELARIPVIGPMLAPKATKPTADEPSTTQQP